MRRTVLGLLMGMGVALAGVSAATAAPIGIVDLGNPVAGAATLQQVQYGGYCARLRWACKHKYELGEAGEGNCRRYRRECEDRRPSYCDRLRWECKHKYELGQAGEGNCRRYRDECGRY
jgi:hypothetical protein